VDETDLSTTAIVDSDQLGPKSDSAEVPVEWNPNYNVFKSVIEADRTETV